MRREEIIILTSGPFHLGVTLCASPSEPGHLVTVALFSREATGLGRFLVCSQMVNVNYSLKSFFSPVEEKYKGNRELELHVKYGMFF